MWLFRPALFPAWGVFLGYPIRSPPATLIDDDPLGRPHTSPKTMAFLSKTASATVNATAGGNYLSPSKLSDGGSVRFALLTDTPWNFTKVGDPPPMVRPSPSASTSNPPTRT
jgi:hypothetical protein